MTSKAFSKAVQYVNDPDVIVLKDRMKENEVLAEILALGQQHGMLELVPISVSKISVAEWVQLKCKYGCKNYGTSWCCPPETPTPEKAKSLLAEYNRALLFIGRSKNLHFYRENHQKRRAQVKLWKVAVAIERLLFLRGYHKAFALVSENCALCKVCAYPKSCKFPIHRRPSMESFAIDVFQTLRNIGKSFNIAQDVSEEHQTYSMVLWD